MGQSRALNLALTCKMQEQKSPIIGQMCALNSLLIWDKTWSQISAQTGWSKKRQYLCTPGCTIQYSLQYIPDCTKKYIHIDISHYIHTWKVTKISRMGNWKLFKNWMQLCVNSEVLNVAGNKIDWLKVLKPLEPLIVGSNEKLFDIVIIVVFVYTYFYDWSDLIKC